MEDLAFFPDTMTGNSRLPRHFPRTKTAQPLPNLSMSSFKTLRTEKNLLGCEQTNYILYALMTIYLRPVVRVWLQTARAVFTPTVTIDQLITQSSKCRFRP